MVDRQFIVVDRCLLSEYWPWMDRRICNLINIAVIDMLQERQDCPCQEVATYDPDRALCERQSAAARLPWDGQPDHQVAWGQGLGRNGAGEGGCVGRSLPGCWPGRPGDFTMQPWTLNKDVFHQRFLVSRRASGLVMWYCATLKQACGFSTTPLVTPPGLKTKRFSVHLLITLFTLCSPNPHDHLIQAGQKAGEGDCSNSSREGQTVLCSHVSLHDDDQAVHFRSEQAINLSYI